MKLKKGDVYQIHLSTFSPYIYIKDINGGNVKWTLGTEVERLFKISPIHETEENMIGLLKRYKGEKIDVAMEVL